MRSTSAGISSAIHLAAVAVMSFLGVRVAKDRTYGPARLAIPLIWPAERPGRGGGGSGTPLPPSKGRLPPPPAGRVFVPPMVVAAVPKLPASAALPDAPYLRASLEHFGDPLGKVGVLSGGPGGGGGFGPGCCGGAGDRDGPRLGGRDTPAAVRAERRTSTPPRLVYKIEPEYPDEARKARYEGTVVLVAEVEPNGRTGAIRVVRGLGLGMDERAVEAVGKWRFAPALEAGRPVVAPVVIEVLFRLL